jgi:hypothetical protein
MTVSKTVTRHGGRRHPGVDVKLNSQLQSKPVCGKRSEQRTLEAAQVLLTVTRPVDAKLSTAEALLSISPAVSPMDIITMPSPFNLLMETVSLDRLAEKATCIRDSDTKATRISPRMVEKHKCGESQTFELPHNYTHLCNTGGRIGVYLPADRKKLLARFRAKRTRRVWRKKIRYGCRKQLADSRIRIKGRFVKKERMKAGEAAEAAIAAATAAEFAIAELGRMGILC